MSGVSERLAALGLTLPEAPTPAGAYTPCVQTGNLVFISGQISVAGSEAVLGTVGAEVTVETAQDAARLCALNLMAHLSAHCGGDLDRVRRVVKLTGFVNATPDFTDHPAVINGASDLMTAVFGDAGRHARAAVGCASLPKGVAVEVEGVFEIA